MNAESGLRDSSTAYPPLATTAARRESTADPLAPTMSTTPAEPAVMVSPDVVAIAAFRVDRATGGAVSGVPVASVAVTLKLPPAETARNCGVSRSDVGGTTNVPVTARGCVIVTLQAPPLQSPDHPANDDPVTDEGERVTD